jgi:hypothetical protein
MTVQDAAKLSQLFYRFWNDTVLPEQAEKACMIAMYYIDENLAYAQENSKHQQERARFTRMENDERAARFEKRFGEKLVTKRKEQE